MFQDDSLVLSAVFLGVLCNQDGVLDVYRIVFTCFMFCFPFCW